MKKIAIFNNKGGVAKTTSVINIAYNMNKKGLKILIVDCDITQRNSFNFFLGEEEKEIKKTKYENIYNTMWVGYEELTENKLNQFDYILFDMPPTISDEVEDIIKKVDRVYVPMQIGSFELSGLMNVLSLCEENLGGVFITMFERVPIIENLLPDVKKSLGDKLLEHIIPFSSSVRTSQLYGMPLEEYFTENGVPKGKAWKVVDAYASLTDEILEREV